jgi:hypothetical protein
VGGMSCNAELGRLIKMLELSFEAQKIQVIHKLTASVDELNVTLFRKGFY